MSAAEVLSADIYEQPRAREYQEVQDIINRRGDRYSELMAKERRVLDTVDRVVNDARLQRAERSSIMHMSIAQIATKMGDVMHEAFLEAVQARSVEDVMAIIRPSERRLYAGILLIVMALLSIMITVASAW